jgi:hypothetical protein
MADEQVIRRVQQHYPVTVALANKAFAGKARNFDRLITALDSAMTYHAEGAIPNPRFVEIKDDLNRQFDTLYDNIKEEYYYPIFRGSHGNDPDLDAGIQADDQKVRDLSMFDLHKAPAYLKRAEAMTGKLRLESMQKFVDASLPFLREASVAAALVKDLKGMAVKRQPKPEEDRRAKYDAPRAGKEAIQQVKAVLEQVTQDARDELESAFIKRSEQQLARYLKINEQLVADGKKPESPHDVFISNKRILRQPGLSEAVMKLISSLRPDEDAYQTVSLVVKEEWSGRERVYVVRDDKDETFKADAKKMADAIRDSFVYKNLEKLDSIIEAKGNFDKITIVGRAVDMWGLKGTFRIAFTDGSNFVVHNQSVYVVNSHGTRFMRYPLTFHDVVLADGSTMKAPSEERMNTVFVGTGENKNAM